MKRKITLTLALTLLLLTACQTQDDDSNVTTTAGTSAPEETEEIITDDLGDIRFDGEEFTMYLAYPLSNFVMEEETGDTVDDAVFERNRLVEERLGITLTYVESGYDTTGGGQSQGVESIRSFVMSGDTSNDVFLHVQHGGMPGLITEGCFIDWNDLPNVDFDKPYWYSNCIRDINYGNKIYAMTGMYNLNILTQSNVLLFNKRICDELQMEYPYQMVLDGTWTVDKFIEMIKNGTRDLNGDTIIDPEVDQFGYWGWVWEQVPALFMGLGGDVLIKDKDNMPVINIETEQNVNIVDTMNEIFALEGAAYEQTTYGVFDSAFNSGKLLFNHSTIGGCTGYRDMVDDFGFIPHPKLDENQENYSVRIGNCGGLTYIPVTNERLELTGAVLEVMSSISYNTVVPAFFDVTLTVKSVRDSESEQMIPIINENASFYDEASGFSIISAVTGNKSLSTYYAEVKNVVEDNVEDIIETYQ